MKISEKSEKSEESKKLTPAPTPAPLPKKKYTLASEALVAARDLIKEKKRWIQDELALHLGRDKEFYPCYPKSADAVSFCALGAVRRINGPAESSAIDLLRESAAFILVGEQGYEKITNDDIFEINDGLGHASVMQMFARAIRAAKRSEATQVK